MSGEYLTNSSRVPPTRGAWATKGGLAILEYGLISGSNFVVGVLLARWFTPREYGAYAIAFSISLLGLILYQALLLEPMTVYGVSQYRESLSGYLQTLMRLHWGVALLITVVLGISTVILHQVSHASDLAGAMAGLTIAAPCTFLFALARRAFYLQLTPGPAAAGAVVYFLLVMLGLLNMHRHSLLTPFSAFLLIGIAALITACLMLAWLRRSLHSDFTAVSMRTAWCEHWTYGRWALASSVAGWLPAYIYFPLLSSFAGMSSAGQLRALMNVSAPIAQTYAALTMLLLPYAAGSQVKGRGAAAVAAKITLLFLAGAALYWSTVLPFRSQMFHLLYGNKYTNIVYLAPLMALESILLSAVNGPSVVLRAMKSPKSVFWAKAAGAVISLLIGIPAMYAYGIVGAVWAIIVSDAVALVLATMLLVRKVTPSQVIPPSAEGELVSASG